MSATTSEALLAAVADAVARARRLATALGPDHPGTWPLLELAAHVETAAHGIEAELGLATVVASTTPVLDA